MKRVLPLFLLVLVLLLCGACTTERERQQMAQVIAEADSMNRNYVPMTSDSLLLEACRYYDRHGTANERMRAHYLLGCIYRDLGEAPRAIDCYQEAADCADTLDNDCDYRTLGCIYSQMGDVFHQQLLFSNEIEARKQSHHYGLMAGDTLGAISSINLMSGIYFLLHNNDSARLMSLTAMDMFKKHGYLRYSLDASTILMYQYIDDPKNHACLQELIKEYDNNYPLFDEYHELHNNKRLFYYYKGKFYEDEGMLDSAEYYYKKIEYPQMLYTIRNSMYKGLLSVYRKRHVADSIAKYAQLYCEVNDSSIAIKDQDLTARLAASYNYARYQKQSLDNAQKANHRLQLSIVLLIVAFIATATAALFRHRYLVSQREKREALEKLKANYAQAMKVYEGKLQQLRLLDIGHQRTIETIQQELEKVKQENTNVKSDNTKTQRLIETLNSQYEQEKRQLTAELDSHITKVEQFERQMRLSEYRKNTIPFINLGIVQRVKIYAGDSHKQLSESDLKLLLETTKEHFPDLISELNNTSGVGILGTYVCILVLINLSPKEITHLLNLSSSHVANLKRDINDALFQDATAITLHKNLTTRYKIFSD